MNILLVNDDGWDAPGLAALGHVAGQTGDVWTAAPIEKMSGCGHQLTLHRSIPLRLLNERLWAVDGTPADCVRVAISRWNVPFDWVWSGINEGANLGCDVYRSGTVAAAREATLLGIPALAISQYQRAWKEPFDWNISIRQAQRVWETIRNRVLPSGKFWNVNLPDLSQTPDIVPTLVDCPLDPNPLPLNYSHESNASTYQGRYDLRPAAPHHDVALCLSGAITLTPC